MKTCLDFYEADHWVFDCDGTLYPNVDMLESLITRRMIAHIAAVCDCSFDSARELRTKWLAKHQTRYTLLACKAEGFDVDKFIANTYLAVNVPAFISQDRVLHNILKYMKGPKDVLTNNPSAYASVILAALGISTQIKHVYGMQENNFILKPDPMAFAHWIGPATNGEKVVFFDDVLANINAAKELGFITVLVGDAPDSIGIADYHVANMNELYG